MKKKLIISICGVLIYAVSINNLVALNIAQRPIDLLITNINKLFSINNGYAIIYFLFEMLFLVTLIIFRKKLAVNTKEMVFSFFSISFLSLIIFLTGSFVFLPHSNISFLLILLILNFGLYLITQGNIIITPLDKFLLHISIKNSSTYGKYRLFFDVIISVMLQILTLTLYKENSITLSLIVVIALSGPIINLYERIFSFHIKKKSDPKKIENVSNN